MAIKEVNEEQSQFVFYGCFFFFFFLNGSLLSLGLFSVSIHSGLGDDLVSFNWS